MVCSCCCSKNYEECDLVQYKEVLTSCMELLLIPMSLPKKMNELRVQCVPIIDYEPMTSQGK